MLSWPAGRAKSERARSGMGTPRARARGPAPAPVPGPSRRSVYRSRTCAFHEDSGGLGDCRFSGGPPSAARAMLHKTPEDCPGWRATAQQTSGGLLLQQTSGGLLLQPQRVRGRLLLCRRCATCQGALAALVTVWDDSLHQFMEVLRVKGGIELKDGALHIPDYYRDKPGSSKPQTVRTALRNSSRSSRQQGLRLG